MTREQQGRPSPAPHSPCPPQARFAIFPPQNRSFRPPRGRTRLFGRILGVFFRRTFIPGEGPGWRGEELELPRSWAGGAEAQPPGGRPEPGAAAAPGDGPPGAPRELSGEGAPGTPPTPPRGRPARSAEPSGAGGEPEPLSAGASAGGNTGGKPGAEAAPAAPRLTWDCSGSSRRRSGPR